MCKYDVLHVFVTYMNIVYILYVNWRVYLRVCTLANWFLFTHREVSFCLVSPTLTLFKRVNAILLSHVPSWVQHLEKLKVPIHQIILLKLLFIAAHFVLSSQWLNIKAFLSIAFSFQHLQGSDMPFRLCSGGKAQRITMRAASPVTADTR